MMASSASESARFSNSMKRSLLLNSDLLQAGGVTALMMKAQHQLIVKWHAVSSAGALQPHLLTGMVASPSERIWDNVRNIIMAGLA